jgi:hypothetical protein
VSWRWLFINALYEQVDAPYLSIPSAQRHIDAIIKRPAPISTPPQANWRRPRIALPSKANLGLLMMLFTRTNAMEIQERRHPR